MKKLKIFIASSEELVQERKLISSFTTRLNILLDEYRINVLPIKWEYLNSSMTIEHKQEDYNKELRQCNACIVLFWTKYGPYTEIELNTAYKLFKSGRGLTQMKVLFKETSTMSPELQEYRESFKNNHSELYRTFTVEDDLKSIFFQLVFDCIKDSYALERKSIEKNISITHKLLSLTAVDEPEYQEYTLELQELKSLLSSINSNVEEIGRAILTI